MDGRCTPTTTAAASEAGDTQSTPITHWNCESCKCPATLRYNGPRKRFNDLQLNLIALDHARTWETVRKATEDHKPRSYSEQAKMDAAAETVIGCVERMSELSYLDYLLFNGDGVDHLTRKTGAAALASWVCYGRGVPGTAAEALSNATLPDGTTSRVGLEQITQRLRLAAADVDEISKAQQKEQRGRVFRF